MTPKKIALGALVLLIVVIVNIAALTLIHKQKENVSATKANTQAVSTLCKYFGYQEQLLELQITKPPVGDTPAKGAARAATLVFEKQFTKESCDG